MAQLTQPCSRDATRDVGHQVVADRLGCHGAHPGRDGLDIRSVALLADTIHNVGDAMTALPLWMAFLLARRQPSPRFTYGFGRAEDLAGVAIVGLILVRWWRAMSHSRTYDPQPMTHVGVVALAAIIGFVGNEAVALFDQSRQRVSGSAALVTDGYHARADGLTSVAVLVGAVGYLAQATPR